MVIQSENESDLERRKTASHQAGLHRVLTLRDKGNPLRRLIGATVLIGGIALAFGPQIAEQPEPSPSPSPRTSSRSDVSLYPVSDLMYSVPQSIRASCIPVDVVTEGEIETLFCSEGETGVYYSLFSSPESMDAAYDTWINAVGVPVADSAGCAAGQPIRSTWRYSRTPGSTEGRMSCNYGPGGSPWIVWTQSGSRILALSFSGSLDLPSHHEKWRKLVQVRPDS